MRSDKIKKGISAAPQRALLHLPAIAHECDLCLDLEMANNISAKTPNICHLVPSGEHYIEQLHKAGALPL